jgi:hypothetical protein
MRQLLHAITNFIFFAAFIFALPALAADKPAIPAAHPVRQRFVPAPPDAAKGNGASFSALHQLAADKPGVLMLMAHAGIGNSFPVGEKDKPKAFDVKVIAGDDDYLKLEVRTEKGSDHYDVKRDGTVSVQVAGHKFTIAYPSVTVSSGDKPTTDNAMIIVNRFP